MLPDDIADRVCAPIQQLGPLLINTSHRVHRWAEPAFAEFRSAELLRNILGRHHFRLSGAPGLPTAFVADRGQVGPRVAIFCEYDALPGLGHACGHNVIAAAGLGAGLALGVVTSSLPGRVRVVGSPAEEGGGGKELLIRAGVLDGVVAALIVHPHCCETVRPNLIAAQQLQVQVRGRAAHASLFPERGINALDALLVGFQAVDALRARLRPGQRVDAVITQGGAAPNIIPDRATGLLLIRGPDRRSLEGTVSGVIRALSSGADALSAGISITSMGPRYDAMLTDDGLARSFARNARRLGRDPAERAPARMIGSTDMGNVSRLVPAIHPMLAISPPTVVPHSAPFAAAAVGRAADRAVLDGAMAMAMTAAEIWIGHSDC